MTLHDAPFVGRDDALRQLAALAGEPLITIVGLAGVGKTRLAREYLKALPAETFGVFVSLVEISNEDEVGDRILAAFGLTPTGKDDLKRLERFVDRRAQPVVVVIDNAEHLHEGVAQVARELAAIPDVHVIATSQRPLGIEQEQLYALGPLSPDSGGNLFQYLAKAQNIDIPSDEAIELAQALDGLPLAIELAAFRAVILSPAQIRARLSDSNQVLGSDQQGRHASLDIALQYAWNHLSPAEQDLSKRLAFFDHALVPSVAAELWPDLNVEQAAQELVARTWVNVDRKPLDDQDTHGSWQLLRAVRTFIWERTTPDERATIADGLRTWAHANLEQQRSWWAYRVSEALAALPVLRSAGDLAAATELVHRISFLAGTLGFRTRTIMRETIAIIDALDETHDGVLCSRLASLASKHCFNFNTSESTVEWAERAVRWAPDPAHEAIALAQQSRALLMELRLEEATVAARGALERFDAAEAEPSLKDQLSPTLLDLLTTLHSTGELELALQTDARGLALVGDDPLRRATYAAHSAQLLYNSRSFSAAEERLSLARTLVQDLPDRDRLIVLRQLPALLAMVRGDYEQARSYLEHALTISEELDHHALLYYCNRALADLSMHEQLSATPYLEFAYFELAVPDNNQGAINESSILLTLDFVYRGAFAEAAARLQSTLEAGESRWAGVPKSCEQMLRAALRFCHGRLSGRSTTGQATEAANAFEDLVDRGLGAIDSRSIEAFDTALAEFDFTRLHVADFNFLLFEHQVRAWCVAELARCSQAVLQIEPNARRVAVDQQVHDFARNATARTLVQLLSERAEHAPGTPVSSLEIAQALWNESEMNPVVLNRVYTIISRFRLNTALGPHLQNDNHGYFLKPSIRIKRVERIEL